MTDIDHEQSHPESTIKGPSGGTGFIRCLSVVPSDLLELLNELEKQSEKNEVKQDSL